MIEVYSGHRIMGTYHTVKEGEYLVKIALDYGFNDYHVIWDHFQNVELKMKRKNANAIFPGDSLFIPDIDITRTSHATGRHIVIKLKPKSRIIRIILKNIDNEPITFTDCTLNVGSEAYNLVTNSDGLVAELLQENAVEGKLTLLDVDIPVQIGELDPVDTDIGQMVRLANLGYYLGSIDEVDEEQLKSAVEEFQCDQGLNISGTCDANTQSALKDAYGC